jgi:hypothetical protein
MFVQSPNAFDLDLPHRPRREDGSICSLPGHSMQRAGAEPTAVPPSEGSQ